MKKKETGTENLMYLAERAAIFFGHLDSSEIADIFPMQKKAWADLDQRVASGSKARLKSLNNLIDNILIGRNSLGMEDRLEILRVFDEKLGEGENALIHKKIDLYNKIIKKGIIDSNLMINDAIEIQNSEILGLSSEQKAKLKEIIILSMKKR
ncbi:MAG: hypothetical protein ABI663_15990 [Chryseolinea sp.]